MHFTSIITGAAVLLASAPTVLALGSATVVNNCGYPVYYASVGQNYNAQMQQLEGSYTEQFSQEGVGISIKLSPNATSSGPISQFEFTWANGKVAYDISNINGFPFASHGIDLVPSMQGDPSNPTCIPINCIAGQAICEAAYNQPDDTRTMVCSEESNLVMTVCPGGSYGKRTLVETINGHVHYRAHPRHLPRHI